MLLAVSAFMALVALEPAVDWKASLAELRSLEETLVRDYMDSKKEHLAQLENTPNYEEISRATYNNARLEAAIAVVNRADEIDREWMQQDVSLFGYTATRRRAYSIGPVVLLFCLFIHAVHMAEIRHGIREADADTWRKIFRQESWVLTSGSQLWQRVFIWLLPAIGLFGVILGRANPNLDKRVTVLYAIIAAWLTLDIYRSFFSMRVVNKND